MCHKYFYYRKTALSLVILLAFGTGLSNSFSCRRNSNSGEQKTEGRIEGRNDFQVKSLPGKDKPEKRGGKAAAYLGEQTKKEAEKKEKLAAIQKINKASKLRVYVQDPDTDIRSAAVIRLGEIGGVESVDLLYEAFQKEPRVKGTDIPAGIKGDAIDALAQTGEKKAKESLLQIVKDYIQEGPLDKGEYSHIYDVQYYQILKRAIIALRFFLSSETEELLESIAQDSNIFYSIREKAWESLLYVQKDKNIQSQDNQIHYFLSKINPEGVFVEKWWIKPGLKSDAAIKESAVENVVIERGWDAVEAIQSYAARLEPTGFAQKTACYRMLSSLLLDKLSERGERALGEEEKKVLLSVVEYLESIPAEVTFSESIAEIYKMAYAAADIIEDASIWNRMKKVHETLDIPSEWKGASPDERELLISLPEGSVFVPGLSSRVETHMGTILRASYFINTSADEVVEHFENLTGRKAKRKERFITTEKKEMSYSIELWPAPEEISGFIELGVTIIETVEGFEEESFGQILRKGKTLFRITRLIQH